MTTLQIEFSSAEDARNFKTYCERANESEGTITGLWAGVACAAIKRATVRESAAPELLALLERYRAATYGFDVPQLCPLDHEQAAAAIAKAKVQP